MDDLISVIVPIYNIKDYIERCVNSIINQTYINLEIILVDDGSNDGSSEICDKLQQRDKRIKVVHKTNGGSSDARNKGVYIAKGQFISFVDGDDVISASMIEELYTKMIKFDADIAMCRMEKIYEDRKYPTKEFPFKNKEEIFSSEEVLKLLFLDIIDCGPCNKLYKSSLFEKALFPVGKLNEDFAILYKLFSYSRKVVYSSEILYHYFFRENSNTSQTFNETQFDKIDNALDAVMYISCFNRNLLLYAKSYLYKQSFYLLNTLYEKKLTNQFKSRYKQILRILKKGTFEILRCRWLSSKERLAYIISGWMPNMYFRFLHNF